MLDGLRDAARRSWDEIKLRKWLRSLLHQAGVTEPVGMLDVVERLSAIWPTPIVASPYDFRAHGPFGLTVHYAPSDDDDVLYILYQRIATSLHQDHVIAHELGHILARHPLRTITDLSEIDLSGRDGTLRRTSYTTRIEHQAETIATTLMWRALASSGVAQPSESDRARAVQRSLGDKVEWL